MEHWFGDFNWKLDRLFAWVFLALGITGFISWATPYLFDDVSLVAWALSLCMANLNFKLSELKRRAAVWFDLCRDHGFVSRKGL